MYYAHFGLKEPPFKITPNTEFFFSGGNRGAVLDALIYAIRSGEGIIKVVGEVGSGKTMLCRMLQTQLPETVETIYLANPSVAPEDILHALAFELQLKLPKNADRLQVMHVLQRYLVDRHAEGKQVVVFVEEAQGMPIATLEEIRLLSNLETRHDKLLQIVLFGQPELDENLNRNDIRQLRERITHSFYLGPLDKAAIKDYLLFRLRSAGYFGPHLFSDAAIRLIALAARGLVRRVNIIADKALLATFAENGDQVKPRHVRAAIADSEFSAEFRRRRLSYLLLGLLIIFSVFALMIWIAPTTKDVAVKTAPVVQEKAIAPEENLPVDIEDSTPGLADEDALTKRLKITESWLRQNPEQTVTIQLMTGQENAQFRAHIESLAMVLELDNLYAFRTRAGDKPVVTLVYGSYRDRQEALLAMQKLPKELKSNQPKLRTIGGILRELK
jgi:type II secretory pathway predicted ATPase ExeA